MRRSAAPSLYKDQKRAKFSAPFKAPFKKFAENGCHSTRACNLGAAVNKCGSPEQKKFNTQKCSTQRTVKETTGNRNTALQSIGNSVKHSFKNPTKGKVKDEVSHTVSSKSYEESYFSVVWCKASTKKHKKWEGDGLLITKDKCVILKDMEGKQIAKGTGYKSTELDGLDDGSTLMVCGKEVEIQGKIEKADYLSGKCFSDVGNNMQDSAASNQVRNEAEAKPFVPHHQHSAKKKKSEVVAPRHDPKKDGALVMPRPNIHKQLDVVDVVVDPFISHYLRPHQRDGVTFLYTCVMGLKNRTGQGAILADEMGLGKTLQCISLVWTLLKQGPYNGVPTVKKIIIVTPGSLVKNWCKEFIKWLGSERILPFAVDGKNRVDEFLLRPKSPVLIISYEMFLRCIGDIHKVKFDMIICDEAHRLKNATVKTASAIASLAISKIVLLTGTPIQNNLQEFYALADMANPGVLGSLNGFKKVFVEPIATSQQSDCDFELKQLGAKRADELSRLTSTFCLRRTAEINKAYLPAKVEYTVFIQMTDLQAKIYRHLLKSRVVRSCLLTSHTMSRHLVCIGALKKLCNDPKLLYIAAKDHVTIDGEETSIHDELLPLFPEDYALSCYEEHSAKLHVLKSLLESFKSKNEKTVIVCNSTKMLDILQDFCLRSEYHFTRLDGQTQVHTRQNIVDHFNHKESDIVVFLLSSKAGGVGLNLTGASKLILYDIDWNPANDLQSMARVWRDGQKKQVAVFRFLLTGSIEEKIYQRQIIKQGLSGAVVDSLSTEKTEFTREDLKDLFTYKESITCSTHELLLCDCLNDNVERDANSVTELLIRSERSSTVAQKKNASMAELMRWEHIKDIDNDDTLDDGLKACDNVSFIFRNKNTWRTEGR